jgi:hypothetical protein
MPANEREILIGFGKNCQDDLATANTAAGMVRLGKLNASSMYPRLITENDAEEFGKGHEFATQVFKTYWDCSGQLEKYLSSEFAAWVMAFSLGKVVKSGSTPNWVYTCTPLNPVTDGIELPSFSFVEQMRPGASSIVDFMNVGCCIEGWTLTIGSGPGRASAKLVADIVGSGKFKEPSAITLPAATTEHLLPASSAAITINGVDYVTAKNFVSLEAGWRNNILLDDGFYPGSGTHEGAAIRGRMEVGNREPSLRFTARFDHSSAEYTKLKAQTEGTAVIGLTYDTNHSMTMTYQRVQFSSVERGGQNGIVTVDVACAPLYHSTNKLLSVVCKTTLAGVAEEEA